MVNIACVMMIRNEEKRILVSLQSIIGICSTLIIYDTGSTDTTIEQVRNFSKQHNLTLHLIEGTFVDFSTSRNILLDYADTFTEIDYLLLLDCNDELKKGSLLLEEVKKLPADISGFLVKQEWWSGELNTYWNVRLVRPQHGWRYEEPVHEFLSQKEHKDPRFGTKLNGEIVLYQDRTKDDDKSAKRFIRDYDILYKIYNSSGISGPSGASGASGSSNEEKNPRRIFYLAQTCGCLNRHEEAYKYYIERGPLENGFWEERFVAYYRAGEIMDPYSNIKYENKNWATALENYIQALDVMPRVEPLLRIIEYYRDKENKYMAYIHAKMACELPFPDHCNLFVDRKAYEYKRWHLLGILAFYFQDFITGKKACEIAIEKGGQQKIDIDNLQFYIKKLTTASGVPGESKNNEQHHVPPVPSLNKNKFIDDKMIELRKSNPRLTKGQLHARALLEWNKLPK